MSDAFGNVFDVFSNREDCVNIAIVGKGASLDKVDRRALESFFVININESEREVQGDVCLFNDISVFHELSSDGLLNCKIYVTSQSNKLLIDSGFVFGVNNIPEGQQRGIDLSELLYGPEFFFDHSLLITAISLANRLADRSKSRLNLYLLGFDFTLDAGFAQKSKLSGSQLDTYLIENLFENQFTYLKLTLDHADELAISINHVGDLSISSLSVTDFNDKFCPDKEQKVVSASLNLKEIKRSKCDKFDKKHGVKIVAEITTNHFGDTNVIKNMIIAAAESGADYVKFQKRDVETFYTKEQLAKPYKSPFGTTFGDYRNGLELGKTEFDLIDQWCTESGINWFASVLDIKSYEFIKEYSVDMVKLPSTISEHSDLIEYVFSDFDGHIVLSTGMTDENFESYILSLIEARQHCYLLQCTSSYPTLFKDANVAVVRHYHDLSQSGVNIIPGYSSHDYGPLCSQLAVAAGAKMIEKHVKLGNTEWGHFDNVAVDMLTGGFKSFVDAIRLTEVCLGDGKKSILNNEHHKYRKNSVS